MSDSNLTNLTVPELKKKLMEYGLSRSGRKNDMVARLELAATGVFTDKEKTLEITNNTDVNASDETGPSGEPSKKKLKTEAETNASVTCKAEGRFVNGKFHENCKDIKCSIDPVRVIVQPIQNALAIGYDEEKLFKKCHNCNICSFFI